MSKSASCLLIVLLLTAAWTLAACDTVKPPPALGPDPLAAEHYPQGVALGGLDEYLVAGTPIIDAATPAKPMHVTVPIRSKADTAMNVQYKFEFFDRSGRPVRTNQGWAFINIAPRVQVFLQAGALDTDATGYRLQLRPAR